MIGNNLSAKRARWHCGHEYRLEVNGTALINNSNNDYDNIKRVSMNDGKNNISGCSTAKWWLDDL